MRSASSGPRSTTGGAPSASRSASVHATNWLPVPRRASRQPAGRRRDVGPEQDGRPARPDQVGQVGPPTVVEGVDTAEHRQLGRVAAGPTGTLGQAGVAAAQRVPDGVVEHVVGAPQPPLKADQTGRECQRRRPRAGVAFRPGPVGERDSRGESASTEDSDAVRVHREGPDDAGRGQVLHGRSHLSERGRIPAAAGRDRQAVHAADHGQAEGGRSRAGPLEPVPPAPVTRLARHQAVEPRLRADLRAARQGRVRLRGPELRRPRHRQHGDPQPVRLGERQARLAGARSSKARSARRSR